MMLQDEGTVSSRYGWGLVQLDSLEELVVHCREHDTSQLSLPLFELDQVPGSPAPHSPRRNSPSYSLENCCLTRSKYCNASRTLSGRKALAAAALERCTGAGAGVVAGSSGRS